MTKPRTRSIKTSLARFTVTANDVLIANFFCDDWFKFAGSKRLIGQTFEKVDADDIKRLPFKVTNKNGKPMYEVAYQGQRREFSPVQISAAVLMEMKRVAEEFLDEDVTDAVITVPARFNDSQRQATKDAAEIAGLKVLRLLSEPTAASIAYGLEAKVKSDQNVLVFDMGGGTFDVSILSIDGEMYFVKAIGGDIHLGGEDFNNKILDYFLNEIKRDHDLDLSENKVAISKLLRECETAKIALSTRTVASVQVKSLIAGSDFKSSMTRACFEDLNADFFKKAVKIVEKTIVDAKLKKTDIDEVVMVGGSTYIPKVREMLQECFPGKKLDTIVKPDEAVAHGAAVFASTLAGDEMEGNDLVLIDVTPRSLGVAHRGGFFYKLIHQGSPIPFQKSCSMFSTAADNQTSVTIAVFEGESKWIAQNNLLGKFTLSGLTKAPARELRIKVLFEIDSDGILSVSASELGSSSGESGKIRVDVFKTVSHTSSGPVAPVVETYLKTNKLSYAISVINQLALLK